MTKVQREERYIVIKRKRLTLEDERAIRQIVPPSTLTDCVVVERDWPEYEPVWAMLEQRIAALAASPPKGESDTSSDVPVLEALSGWAADDLGLYPAPVESGAVEKMRAFCDNAIPDYATVPVASGRMTYGDLRALLALATKDASA